MSAANRTAGHRRRGRPPRDVPAFPVPAFPVLEAPRQDDDPSFTPYIVLKSEDPAIPFYLSPNIWVTDLQEALVLSPKVGTPYIVWALVSNMGMMDAVDVNVRFWWAHPSPAITEASAHPIGVATGVYIKGSLSPLGNSVSVPCPTAWTPQFDPDDVLQKFSHECLLAKAWCPGFDPAPPLAEPQLDMTDRRSAQHNLTVVQGDPGQSFKLRVDVVNISRFALDATVEVRSLRFADVARGLHAAQLGTGHEPIETRDGLPMEVALSTERTFQHGPNRTFARLLSREDEAAVGGREDGYRPRGRLTFRQGTRLDPWERRVLTIAGRVPASALPGQAFGFEISQYLGDLLVGGYTAFVVVTPE